MARTEIHSRQGQGRGARWIIAAIAAGVMLGGLTAAGAEERQYKSKRYMVACEEPQRMTDLYRLARSPDTKAFNTYVTGLMRDESCTSISPDDMVYVEQMDVLDKGIRGGLEDAFAGALSEALGFNVPTQAKIVRIRVAGEPTYYYTLLEFLL
jgi:hypothetical protein